MLERFSSGDPAPGTLYLTATHLIFVDPRNKKETWVRVATRAPLKKAIGKHCFFEPISTAILSF